MGSQRANNAVFIRMQEHWERLLFLGDRLSSDALPHLDDVNLNIGGPGSRQWLEAGDTRVVTSRMQGHWGRFRIQVMIFLGYSSVGNSRDGRGVIFRRKLGCCGGPEESWAAERCGRSRGLGSGGFTLSGRTGGHLI